MSELRHDPLNRRWVIVSMDRVSRPADFELVHEHHVGKEQRKLAGHHPDQLLRIAGIWKARLIEKATRRPYRGGIGP